MSKRVVLLGQPVTHSLSEALQEAAFAAAGIDARYEPIDTPTVDLARCRSRHCVARSTSAPTSAMPHKDRVATMLDRLTEEAQATGAVDTITRDGDQLVGHNTDVHRPSSPRSRSWWATRRCRANAVVVGAGGGGRAVDLRAHLDAASRTSRSSTATSTAASAWSSTSPAAPAHMELKARPWHESVIEAELAKTDILINASAMGRDPEETPIPGELLPPDILVLDLH